MNARVLRDNIAAASGLTKKQVDDYFSVISEVIGGALASGEKVDLLKFGNLKIKNYPKWQENLSLPDIVFISGKGFDELFKLAEPENREVPPMPDRTEMPDGAEDS